MVMIHVCNSIYARKYVCMEELYTPDSQLSAVDVYQRILDTYDKKITPVPPICIVGEQVNILFSSLDLGHILSSNRLQSTHHLSFVYLTTYFVYLVILFKFPPQCIHLLLIHPPNDNDVQLWQYGILFEQYKMLFDCQAVTKEKKLGDFFM